LLFQFIILDTRRTSARFHNLNNTDNLLPSTVHEFSYSKDTCELSLFVEENSDDSWLQFVLFKKLQSWIESSATQDDQQQLDSHQLIDSESYNRIYAELKEKYGKKLEEGWNESTDPKKFIYEDIAIASYLIVLWKEERNTGDGLQSFVDLGCGNGLLVYLLSQEGHRGYGIDLRKRKIWDQFPRETDLREAAIVPSDESLFTDVDWIIGNHSDELSPWVSVIAARSSFTSKYFLLPCCAFEFSGEKYQRKNGKKSQYLSYMDYLMTVSEQCGFADTKIDRLKIPSTKRICLIGTKRIYDEENFKVQCDKIQNFINEANVQQGKGNSEKWSEAFIPREKIEAVKNCSKVDRSLSNVIVTKIFNQLLTTKTYSDDYPSWNCGGEISIPEAVKLISQDELKKLKSECGGLQTLLKNKHQIFHIYGGSIRIRKPKRISDNNVTEKSLKRNVVKTMPCYFFHNHPDACPVEHDDCCYIH
jgi:tRNASer (uridine44-2'-O)-methyltransferase